MKLDPLRWVLATGVSMGLAATAVVLAPGIDEWGLTTSDRALGGAKLALAIAALRPWWLIKRGARAVAQMHWISHLRQRAGNTTRFLRGPLPLAWPLRDELFRAHGWLAGFAFGVAIAEVAQSSLTQWLFGSRFEGAAVLLGPLLGVLAGAFVALALDRVPRLAAAWRLEGQVDAQASAQILEHGAGALLLLMVLMIAAWIVNAALVLELPLITLAALVGYALPWLLWREQAEHKRGLWLVVLEPDSDGAQRGALTMQLVDALARRWRDGPLTVVFDAALDVGGEQLHAALNLGRERAMFPRIVVELADWGRLLPPPQRWLASPLRELHLPAPLMLPALERFAGEGDQIVLVSGSVEPLAAWRERFRHADCLVAWHGDDDAAAAGSTVAGFRAVSLDALVSSGLLPSLPDRPLKAPTQAAAVQPLVTKPEAAMQEQAVVPELPPAPSPQPEPGPDIEWLLLFTGLLTPVGDCIASVKDLATLKRLHDRLHRIRQFGIRRWREVVLTRWPDDGEVPAEARAIYFEGMKDVKDLIREIRGLFGSLADNLQTSLSSIPRVVDHFPINGSQMPEQRELFEQSTDRFASRVQTAFTACDWMMRLVATQLATGHQLLVGKGRVAQFSQKLTLAERKLLGDGIGQSERLHERLQAVLAQHNDWQRIHDDLQAVDDHRHVESFETAIAPVINIAQETARLAESAAALVESDERRASLNVLIDKVCRNLDLLVARVNETAYEAMRKAFDDLFFEVDHETLKSVEESEQHLTDLEQSLRGKEAEFDEWQRKADERRLSRG